MDEESTRVDVKLPIRSLQVILRGQLNRQLHLCELALREDGQESRLIVRLHGVRGTVRTHKLTYEAEPAQYPRDSHNHPNRVVAEIKTISLLLDNFVNKGMGEVMMICERDYMNLKSKDDDLGGERKLRKALQTVVKVHRSHFSVYDIRAPTVLTFGLREFRAPISLADHLQCPLELRFGVTGEPLSMHIQAPSMYGHILLATTAPDDEQQREMAESNVEPQSDQHGAANSTRRVGDQEEQDLEVRQHSPDRMATGQTHPSDMTTVTQNGASNNLAGDGRDTSLSTSHDAGNLFRGQEESSDRDEERSAHSNTDDEEMPRTQDNERNKRTRYNPLF